MKGWNNPKMMVLEDEFLDFKLRDFLGSSRKRFRGVIHKGQNLMGLEREKFICDNIGEKNRCTCVFLSFDVTIGDALAAVETNSWAERDFTRAAERESASDGPMSGDTNGEAKLDAAEEKVHQKLGKGL